jgi:hypothetical protein
MNGQSLVKAFVPLPGQAMAVYTSTGLDHYQHADWIGLPPRGLPTPPGQIAGTSSTRMTLGQI